MSPEQWEYVNGLHDWFSQHYLMLGVNGFVGIALGGFVWYIWPRKPEVKVPGEGAMKKAEYILSKREQRQQDRNTMADLVGDMLLTALAQDKLSNEKYRYWLVRFGTLLNLKDLLPGEMTPADIKKALKAKRSLHPYKPVPFVKEEKVKKPRNIIDKLLNAPV